MNRFVYAMIAAALFGCSVTRQPAAVSPGCQQTCLQMWNSCKLTCQKAVDPTDRIRGSHENCEQVCGSQRDGCELDCSRGQPR